MKQKDFQLMDYPEIPYVRYSIQSADISSDNSANDVHSSLATTVLCYWDKQSGLWGRRNSWVSCN